MTKKNVTTMFEDLVIFNCTADNIWTAGAGVAGLHIDARVITDKDDPDYGEGMTFRCPHCKVVYGVNYKG